jgi:hypothetical protein
MVARAFAELFVAGCLELEEGEVRRYRARADLDLELLDRVERLVVRCLDSFRSVDELLALCAGDGVERAPAGARERDLALLAEAGEVIDEALEYLAPACSCSI